MQFAGVHFFTKRGYGEEMHAMSDSEEEEDDDLYQNYNNLQTVCRFGMLSFIFFRFRSHRALSDSDAKNDRLSTHSLAQFSTHFLHRL